MCGVRRAFGPMFDVRDEQECNLLSMLATISVMQAKQRSVGAYSGQSLAMVGVPTDVHSSFLRGAARRARGSTRY